MLLGGPVFVTGFSLPGFRTGFLSSYMARENGT